MLFCESSFLFFFLPAVLLAYYGLGRRLHDGVLVVFSLIFYWWGEHLYVAALLLSIVMNWAFALGVCEGKSSRKARIMLALAIAANLMMLGSLKYANFAVDNLNVLLAAFSAMHIALRPVHLPIGISFFAFQGMSYVIDVYRGTCPPQPRLLKMAMYKSFFPQLIAGPIVRYVDVKEQIENRTATSDDFAAGIRRFIIGLAKKMVIANVVARPVDEIFAVPAGQLTPVLAWLAVVGYGLQIYFDFSAYSDMAIGLARMFGFRFLENFNYPYIAGSMTDFWRRWHISLSGWFRDYLYIPLGGNRVAAWRVYVNLLIVFLLCGFWHGASWSFAIWGLFHGVFLILERMRFLPQSWTSFKPLRHAYVIAVVLVSWVFFRAATISAAMSFLAAMCGAGGVGDALPDVRMFADAEVVLAFVLGIVGAMPVYPWLAERFTRLQQSGHRFGVLVEPCRVAGMVLAFVYCEMLIAAGSYSPFIYYRF